MKELIKKWESLDPKVKQRAILGTVALVLLLILFSYASSRSAEIKSKRVEAPRNVTTDLLTGRDTSGLGIEGNSMQIRKIREANEERDLRLDDFMKKVEQQLKKADTKLLQSEIIKQGAELKNLQRQVKNNFTTQIDLATDINAQTAGSSQVTTVPVITPTVYRESDSWRPKSEKDADIPSNTLKKPKKLEIKLFSAANKATEEDEGEEQAGEEIYIPAGSILSGTLIVGMDAPTNESAKSDPYPVLMRIKGEAILPNMYSMDIRECFIIGAGFGDLSSERAYVRGESISCINDDEEILESSIDLFAVGEDGKTGLRGRLVSKQGQILARALMAGFMEGIAGAFAPQKVQAISLQPGEDAQFESLISTQALGSAALNGTSKAVGRLADYYIKIAEGIFPVIEIDAGRRIDMINKKGMMLKFVKVKKS